MFYPREEFEAQMNELVAQGLDRIQAYKIVSQRELKDEQEYQKWLDVQREEEEDWG